MSEGKTLVECWMLMAEIRRLGEVFPLAVAIVIARTTEEAHKFGERELEPYFPGYPYRLGFSVIGSILLDSSSLPETVLFYTREGGIKKSGENRPEI